MEHHNNFTSTIDELRLTEKIRSHHLTENYKVDSRSLPYRKIVRGTLCSKSWRRVVDLQFARNHGTSMASLRRRPGPVVRDLRFALGSNPDLTKLLLVRICFRLSRIKLYHAL